MDGETVLCASLPVCTPLSELQEDAQLVAIDVSEDPNGIVEQFAQENNAIVTTDNIVHFTLAEHQK